MTSRWRRDSGVERPVEVDTLRVGPGRGRAATLVAASVVDPPQTTPGVDREVAGDPHDPRLGVAADLAPAHEGAGEGLLGDVFGLAAASEELVRDPVGARVEVLERLFEREVDRDRRDRRASDSSTASTVDRDRVDRRGVAQPPVSLPTGRIRPSGRKVDTPSKISRDVGDRLRHVRCIEPSGRGRSIGGGRRPVRGRGRGAARAPGAARGPAAAPHARRGRRPGAPARPGPAAAGADRGRPAVVGGPLGPARHRQDHHRPARRRRDRARRSSRCRR